MSYVSPSNLFFFEVFTAILDPFPFHWNIRIVLSTYILKNPTGILTRSYLETIDQLREN